MYKRALVTGGAGFIGSHIAEMLLEKGIETVVIDNFSTGKKSNIPEGATVVKGDILDEKLLKHVTKNIDVVFHEAAVVSIRNSFDDCYHDVETNILGTVNLLKAMGHNRVKKIIYASSMAVYADASDLPIAESHLLNPISPYGISKLAGEKYSLLMGKYYNFDVVCLRYFNTFGPRQTMSPYVGVITIFINKLIQAQAPVIFGNGSQIRDFIHVQDVARANLLAMQVPIKSAVFNIGTGRGTSVNEIADLLIKTINPSIKPVYAPSRIGEPKNSVADITEAKKILDFYPDFKIQDKIDEVIAWWKH